MQAHEIADRLLDHPAGATPERLAKAMALAERLRRPRLFQEALAVGLAARKMTLERAALQDAHARRLQALQVGYTRAMARKNDDPHKALLLQYFPAAIAAHAALGLQLERTPIAGTI